MLERVKRAVVESYIGAIALGYLLAQVILHFVGVFATPISTWAVHLRYKSVLDTSPISGLSYRDALPDLARFVLSLFFWYLLLYWLYMKPSGAEKSEASPEPH